MTTRVFSFSIFRFHLTSSTFGIALRRTLLGVYFHFYLLLFAVFSIKNVRIYINGECIHFKMQTHIVAHATELMKNDMRHNNNNNRW